MTNTDWATNVALSSYTDDEFNLGICGSHDASIAISKGNKILEVVEIEKFTGEKHANLIFNTETQKDINSHIITEVLTYFRRKYQANTYNTVFWNLVCYHNQWLMDDLPTEIKNLFPSRNFKRFSHHLSHASSAFYQSPYNRALIITFDGGSDEGLLNVYIGNGTDDLIHLYSNTRNYCVPYAVIGHFIYEIKNEPIYQMGQFTYPGKMMGLAGDGEVADDIEQNFTNYFEEVATANLQIPELIDCFAKHMNISNSVQASKNTAKTFAATAQVVFEKLLHEEIGGFLKASHGLPIVLSGGGALNIINNSRIAKSHKVFVPPNPNDSGIAIGLLCNGIRPKEKIDCAYLGPDALDSSTLEDVVALRNGTTVDLNKLADNIIAGKIYGVVRGRSECGPRALGNRSLICSAIIPEMKDILNSKIKNRESFRPFAPVVRLEDVHTYFKSKDELRFMSFNVEIHKQYESLLYAVSSSDNTARVQTITREQNEFLYDLLTLLDKKVGHGILLNTSFNLDGKPILNKYADALDVLDTKDIDGVIFENYLIEKSK
jgi:carbamoyltransferase